VSGGAGPLLTRCGQIPDRIPLVLPVTATLWRVLSTRCENQHLRNSPYVLGGGGGGRRLVSWLVYTRDAVDGGSKKVQPGSSRSICLAYAALTPAELAENIR